MKQIKGGVRILSLVATILIPTIAQAGLPFTRLTHDSIIMYDDGNTVQAYSKSYGTTKDGVVDIDRLNRELDSEDALRVTESRINIEMPKNKYCDGSSFNPYCDGTTKEQDVFPDKDIARKWVASFFTPETVFNIEADLAILMESQEATRAFYHFNTNVKVRNKSAPTEVEDRLLTYTIVLNKNQYPGQGTRSGVFISDSEFTTNLYVVYRNTNNSYLLDDRVSVDDAGYLIVYEMFGNVPEDSVLTEVARLSNPDFDTERLVNPTTYFEYETKGVKKVLEVANEYKKQYASEIVVVDYYNPVDVTMCPLGDNGKCLSQEEAEEVEEPYFSPKINVFTTERTFFRNVCTGAGVTYKQSNHIQAETEEFIERYILTPPTQVSANMTDSELLALDRFAPYNFDGHGLLEADFNNSHSFDYNTDVSFFETRITDYLGKNATAPNNVFVPQCQGSSTYENEGCYEANGLHHEHYINYYSGGSLYPIAQVEDISIVDVIYQERVKVADSYSYTDEDGEIVDVPAEYEWQNKNSCATHNGTRKYNVDSFCSPSNINCLSVKTK